MLFRNIFESSPPKYLHYVITTQSYTRYFLTESHKYNNI